MTSAAYTSTLLQAGAVAAAVIVIAVCVWCVLAVDKARADARRARIAAEQTKRQLDLTLERQRYGGIRVSGPIPPHVEGYAIRGRQQGPKS